MVFLKTKTKKVIKNIFEATVGPMFGIRLKNVAGSIVQNLFPDSVYL